MREHAPAPRITRTHTSIGLTVSGDGREVVYSAVPGTPEADILLLELDSAAE